MMNQALYLDIHTLSLLLERNYHQHRRCKYYQRMSMVLSSLKQLPSFELVSNQMQELKRLVTLLLLDGNDGEHQDVNYMERKRRAKEEEEWTLEQSNDSKTVSQNKDTHQQQEQLQQISTNIQQLKTLTTKSLPILISRIIHATSPILHEISRGYFVPFLTVALGCLGRIHCLLLQFGREIVSILSEVVPQLRVACSKHEKSHDWKMLERIVLPTFVIETTEKNTHVVQTKGSVTSSSTTQEWNDLMTHYIEVSQDSITKQMNEFAKRKRLDNARLRFGVGKDIKKNASNDAQEGDDGDEQSADNDDEIQLSTDSINDTSDMGELVSMQDSGASSLTQIKSSEGVDPNMARIQQRRESTKSTPATDSSSSKKKKRRKKKKKEQPEVDGTDEDDPVSNNVNEEQVTQHSEHLDKATDTSVTASDLLTFHTTQDHPSDIKDMKKRKKSKKKDKKSKKRKKASSVIDDIFG